MVKDRSDNKLYAIDELIDAIGDKFGSLEEYARTKGLTKQTISAKIRTQSRKFIKALKQDGILIDNSRENDSRSYSFNSGGTNNDSLKRKVEKLEKEKEELKKENEELKIQNAELKGQIKIYEKLSKH